MSYQNKKSAGERSVGLILVVLFHVLLVWGLASGLAHDLSAKVADVIQTKVVEEAAPPEEVEPPPPPPDTKIPPPEFVPPPSFDFVPDAGPTTAIQNVTKTPPPKAEPAAMTKAKPAGKGLSRPEYPAASIRAAEEGVVGLSLNISAEGRVTEASVVTSSGFERLDEAAVKHAKRSWKFIPCMQGETPVACVIPLNFRWKIEDAKN